MDLPVRLFTSQLRLRMHAYLFLDSYAPAVSIYRYLLIGAVALPYLLLLGKLASRVLDRAIIMFHYGIITAS